jgi:hypothetical protein
MGTETDEAVVDDDLRGDIEAALGDSEGSAQANPDPLIPEAEPPLRDNEPPVEGSGKPSTGRDSLGRFLPKEPKTGDPGPAAPPGTQPLAQPAQTQPAAAQAPATGQPAAQAPAGWSVLAQEAWANVPPVVQQEIARREYDVMRFVQETGPARQLGEQFWERIQPFMGAIQAEGVDPLTAVENLLTFGTRMRLGTPGERALTIANIVKAYGVGIEDLDNALVNGRVPQSQQANGHDPQYVQQAVQQALQPLYQAAQARQAQLQQAAEEHTRAEIEAFAADPKHKYFPDLRGIMADLVDVAQKNGGDISYEDAYQRAALLHPEISKVIIAQRQGVNAHQLTQAAQRAKAAAVSVNGAAPVGNPAPGEPTSIRESIEAAIEGLTRY